MEPNKIIQKLKNEDGAALVMAMMVLMVLSILGAMVGTLTVGSYRLSANNQDYNSAYYIAEAGANMAYEEIKEVVNTIYGESSTSGIFFEKIKNHEILDEGRHYDNFETQSGHTPNATVTIDINESNEESKSKTYTIHSVGVIDGKERIVEKTFQVNWKNKESGGSGENFLGLTEDTAIFFRNIVNFGNNDISHTGVIAHDGTGTINDNNKNNHVTVDPSINWVAIDKYVNYTPSDAILLDEYEYQTTTGSPPNDKITIINTQGNTVNLILSTLDRSIEIINGGKVNLYVDTMLSKGSNKYDLNATENADPQYLNIFFKGSTFHLGQDSVMNGLLYAPYATVSINQSVRINGSVIANKVELNNSTGVSYPPGYEFDYPTPDYPVEEDPNESKDLIEGSPALENNN